MVQLRRADGALLHRSTDLRSPDCTVELLAGEAAEMEKIPAACALEWSIELEKALRSKVPGRAVEVISLAGHRQELAVESRAGANNVGIQLDGLVPGEQRLFANAILLRLVEAFLTGERHMKLAVVRALLGFSKCERKRRMRKRGK